ncbi:hypothetical protein SFBSU_006G262 [Candidatus Arthromitus sp. SFB-mouse-SU]|nr:MULTISPECIES: DUF4342 domain-containing protein [unclassified Candidatus Arthromitus]EIA22160.1 hypothetical protein SFB1_309G1 [Candidatus Arthromitus sp. SFB-1]EIA26401.1 hypothetical protein SFB3_028G1 [Candidatus Arthromitus sp. SFB-3]EIA28531.1 hypothetical protein SFB6_042G17 [Candidatus Arthromitus sp. SFB-co]EIA28909.1 hypothetical protein SFB4_093G1 [Candidatus Arthromitus sp. SFB-4]EIA30581.1 hypothetical protein SFBSU_006G262 [Candidatus Arthromitus sp. SFB-mouse-SU]BAK79639.1 U
MGDNLLFQNMEILKEKFGVTYKEAKEVLQNSNNDLIEALIYLEERYPIKECCSVKSYILDFKKRLLELYVEGSNQRVIFSKGGNVLMDIPLTAFIVGSFTFVLYPILLPFKIGGILLFDIHVKVVDKSGNVYDVNSNVKQRVNDTISTSKEKISDIISNVNFRAKTDDIKTKAVEFGKKAMENFNGIVENKIASTIKEKSSNYAKFIYDVESDQITKEVNYNIDGDNENHDFIEVTEFIETLESKDNGIKTEKTEENE